MSAVGTLREALASVFLTPFGIVALAAAIPILLLYLLKPDPTRVTFPAVEFLLGDTDEQRRHPALRRLQRSGLLAIQLLAVAAFAISLASPYVPVSEERAVEETVVVVDASASMATQADGTTRFDRAVAAAKDDATDRTSVVVAGPETAVRAQGVPAPEARSALDDLRVTGASGDLASAIDRGATIAGDDARIVVASDFADDGWTTAVSAARARGHAVELRQFDEGGSDNVGVVDYSFDAGSVSVQVKNFGDSAVERRVEFGSESKSLALDPGDVKTATLPVPAGGGDLRLTPGDSFPVDDRVPVAAPDDPTIDVLVVTNDENRALTTALSVIRGTDVTVKNPPASVSGSYDVVVFSGVEPGRLLDGTRQVARETLSRGGGVVVQAQPNLSAVEYGGLLPVEPEGTAENPAVGQPADSPLTAGVAFPAPSSYVEAELRDGRALLETTNGTPLLATASVDDGKVLYYGYSTDDSTFERNYRYPVFWKRAIYDLTGRQPLSERNRATGERVRFAGNASDGEATVETPAGRREAGTLTLGHVGFYEGAGERYAASLADADESNVTAASATEAAGATGGEGTSNERTESRTVPLDLTGLAAGGVAALVLLELGFLRYRGDL
ncbi:vWA domain-containing protein [Halorussus amylolyticus]|uniref:vWA domain-containing protein n=1 Tax=Halorussus amylolyticus TaxID=1126242 RepID=UPI00104EDC16|nr:BatA and WFA domain-containing protein [Halorussus amylolyticus]